MLPVNARKLLAAVVLLLVVGACSGGGTTTSGAGGPTTTAVGPAPTTTRPLAALAWQERQPSPVVRQEVASAAFAGKVWVIGGLTGADASTRVDTYDPASDTWASQPDLPIGLHHSAAVVYRGELVVVGGFTAAASLYSRPSDRVLVLRGQDWVDGPRLRRPRGAAAAAVVGDTLVVAGGRDATDLIAPSESFDGTTWSERAAIPEPRDHLAAVADAGAFYAVGGRFLAPARTTGAAERYDPATDRWTVVADMPTPRGGHGLAFAGGRLVAVGGEDATRVFGEAEAFDPAAGTWSTLPPLDVPRHGLAVASVGPVVLALVGGTESGVAPSAAAEALS